MSVLADDRRNWPEDFPDENGNYQNQCVECGNFFIGYKRRVVCKLCAIEYGALNNDAGKGQAMTANITPEGLRAMAKRYDRGAGFPEDSRTESANQLRAHAAALEENAKLRAEVERMRGDAESAIVGYMVHSESIEHAALYPLGRYAEAEDAARRWNRSITALTWAKGCPDPRPAIDSARAAK
jgi:phage tail sheath gpL-like